MPRFKLTLEYDGAPFSGWQRQANAVSVQEAVEAALLALTGEDVHVQAAGRTDAGVHASGQTAHVDLARDWRCDVLRDALNAWLRPQPVAALAAERVAPDFNARFSAVRRHYLYRIVNRRAPLTFERGRAWLVRRRLDARAMHDAAQRLVGFHDFSTFRDSECQANSPLRTLERFDVSREDDVIACRVSARSFLHSQVRSMVGSLEHVGSGRWRAADLVDALEARDRRRCGQVAPPDGLFLTQVDY
ncbi:tRNA pseudouridine(38-40) synthase TruA [Methylocella sp.]|uniref:tRNA pseudouridine(38-40) synthase TruA n=1 Tax=Methylocella sp. TaxID=1978226 RepID=UPI0037836DCF